MHTAATPALAGLAPLDEAASLAAAVTASDSALVFLLDEAGERLVLVAATGFYARWAGSYSFEAGHGLTGWTALGRSPAIIAENPSADPRYFVSPELGCPAYESVMTYPLIAPSDRLVGVLMLNAVRPRAYDEATYDLVAPLCALAAAAVATGREDAGRARAGDALEALAGAAERSASPAATARSLHRHCDAARALTGAPLVVLLRREAAGRWRLAARSGVAPPAAAERLLLVPLLEALAAQPAPAELNGATGDRLLAAAGLDRRGEHAGTAAPLEAGGERVGLLLCLGGEGPLAPGAAALLRIIASHAALTLLGQRLAERVSAGNAEDGLLEALRTGDEPDAVVRARGRRVGVDLAAPHAILVVDALDDAGDAAGAALGALREELRARVAGSVCATRERAARALVPSGADGAGGGPLADALEAAAHRSGVALAGGLSDVCATLARYPAAFDEALQAARIGRVTRGAGAVVRFADLGAQRHLWALAQEPPRGDLDRRLALLEEHDRARGTQLWETVEGLLEANGNQTEAAARLYLHRNTLRQRLRRVHEVSGLDLDDAALRFDLHMAVRIGRFRRLMATPA